MNINVPKRPFYSARYTFALHLSEHPNQDLFEIKRALGHQSIVTTEKYIRMYNMIDVKNYGSKIDVLFNGCFSKELDPKEKFINKNIKKVISPIKSCFPGILDVHKRDLWGYFNYLKYELIYKINLLIYLFYHYHQNTYL